MAHYWMDVSRDDGSVMSVVAGCDACSVRSAANNIAESKLWITRHAEKSHTDRESRAIRQIGEPVPNRAGHVRWHTNRNVVNPDCGYCNEA